MPAPEPVAADPCPSAPTWQVVSTFRPETGEKYAEFTTWGMQRGRVDGVCLPVKIGEGIDLRGQVAVLNLTGW